jgi:hypothetical protein
MSAALLIALEQAHLELVRLDNGQWAVTMAAFIRCLSKYASAADYRRFLAELIELLQNMEV